ncbi:GNAT family N-acetyltransferase [Haladaptatus sp. AB618]|uniref:GNAT family N-acetyltransferase n=1 Tax=Haladaptatus sp. AB618 TaxID=2934173 RepID=UPI00209C4393|nr:GNAT family N-acetyltransferase [Haladaptatus sp. AB618]MCO8252639.1 GNAT family N-acetyltransferase [Haladaptatus sp. AB618]
MEIRPATTSDAADIRRVARAAWQEAYDFLPPKEHDAAFNQWYTVEQIEARMADDEAETLVATTDDELVGYGHATAQTHADSVGEGELTDIYVDPDHWRTGIGTALLSGVEDRLHERGLTRLKAPVLADSESGTEFLESNGFERIEERITDLFTGGTREQYVYHHQFTG